MSYILSNVESNAMFPSERSEHPERARGLRFALYLGMTIGFPYHLSAFVTSKAQGYSISPGVFLVGYLDIKIVNRKRRRGFVPLFTKIYTRSKATIALDI